eukprot:2128670-Pyramimonas_sp.AAC.1
MPTAASVGAGGKRRMGWAMAERRAAEEDDTMRNLALTISLSTTSAQETANEQRGVVRRYASPSATKRSCGVAS